MIYYKHTQPGWGVLLILGTSTALTAVWAAFTGWNILFLVLSAVQIIAMVLFASLTVEITGAELALTFGPGLIRKRWHLKDIASCHAVRNAWWYGLGIHFTPHGWLYNVSGLDAVEVKLHGGKRLRIGTDVPHELERAVGQAIYEHDPHFQRPA
jgi:hypothetical protein